MRSHSCDLSKGPDIGLQYRCLVHLKVFKLPEVVKEDFLRSDKYIYILFGIGRFSEKTEIPFFQPFNTEYDGVLNELATLVSFDNVMSNVYSCRSISGNPQGDRGK